MTEAATNAGRLRAVREDLGLEVDAAARRLGITPDELWRIENGWVGDDELRALLARLHGRAPEAGPRRISELLPAVVDTIVPGAGEQGLRGALETYLADNRDFIARRTAEIQRAEAEEAERRRRAAFAEAEARVPKKFHGRLLDSRPTAAVAAVAALIAGETGILVLTGPHGTGKSHGGALACVHRRGTWVPMGRLLELWTGDARRQLCAADLIVLDEVGREGGSLKSRAAAADAAEEIVHLASEDERSVVLTSNLTLDALRAWFETRREDGTGLERWTRFDARLREHGLSVPIAVLRPLGGQLLREGVVHCPTGGIR